MAEPEAFLRKAVESLAGADLEFNASLYNNCANRCYYACFQAAIFALLYEGVARRGDYWGHDFVQAEFIGHLINRRKVYASELRDILNLNYSLRRSADYQELSVSRIQASRALQRSHLFVGSIQRRPGRER